MKALHILLLLACLSSVSCNSSLKTFSGNAQGTLNKHNKIVITRNDSLNKLKAALTRGEISSAEFISLGQNIIKNKILVRAKNNGNFRIRASRKDTFVFSSYRFISQKIAIADFEKNKGIHIRLEPQPCKEYVPCEEKPKLHIAILEKIKVEREEYTYYCNRTSIPFDRKFKGTYKVIENVYGDFKTDTISFSIYDHYGRPPVEQYDKVIFYVYDNCGVLNSRKYTYTVPVRSNNGEWVVPFRYQSKEFLQLKKEGFLDLLPKPMTFEKKINFIVNENISNDSIKKLYPSPYFITKGRQVEVKYGYTLEELLEIKRRTIFDNTDLLDLN